MLFYRFVSLLRADTNLTLADSMSTLARGACCRCRAWRSTGARSAAQARFVATAPRPHTVRRGARAPPTMQMLTSVDPVIRVVQAERRTVVLFQGPTSRLWYSAGVASFVGALAAGGLWLIRWTYELPTELPYFVFPTYVIIAVAMSGIATYGASALLWRLSSIEAVPASAGRRHAHLRVRGKFLPLPWARDRVFRLELGDGSLSEKLHPVVCELQDAARARRAPLTDGLPEWVIFWPIILPARAIDRVWLVFFRWFKFIVLRIGVVYLDAHGQKWKIDARRWLLEDGKGASARHGAPADAASHRPPDSSYVGGARGLDRRV